MKKQSRRQFIETTSIITAGLVTNQAIASRVTIPKVKSDPVCIFTKCLQFLDYDRLGEVIAGAGFDGADLSVRKGGHVLPENVAASLPNAVKALRKSGLTVPMMVTDINNPDDPLVEKVLGTAASLGIKHYRMGYWNYDPAKPVQQTLEVYKRTMEQFEKINRKFGIHGEYQNHAGIRVGGPVWDVYWILKDCNPEHIGSQYDIRHAVCEGGSAWPLGLKLLSPWIRTNAIKDFLWVKENLKWIIKDMPLGEGMVDYDAFLAAYKRLEVGGPFSIHYEYDLGGAESGKTDPKMSLEKISTYLKNDLKWLKRKFEEHGI